MGSIANCVQVSGLVDIVNNISRSTFVTQGPAWCDVVCTYRMPSFALEMGCLFGFTMSSCEIDIITAHVSLWATVVYCYHMGFGDQRSLICQSGVRK